MRLLSKYFIATLDDIFFIEEPSSHHDEIKIIKKNTRWEYKQKYFIYFVENHESNELYFLEHFISDSKREKAIENFNVFVRKVWYDRNEGTFEIEDITTSFDQEKKSLFFKCVYRREETVCS